MLLQPGKTDAGALFTSNVSSAAFDKSRRGCRIKRATYYDRIVGCIVMPQDPIGSPSRPGQHRFF
ncbi:hypothetical protein [Leptolyngbya sp. 7M]|uniref:hypothetical protein n=1 Tax=Leptolyngbya sp. 7M TaxID=2812896 RepID=UPI0039772C0E